MQVLSTGHLSGLAFMQRSDGHKGSDHREVVEALWQTFQDKLRRFVITRIPTEPDAEDVLHEIFLRIHKGASRIQHGDRVQAWVFAVARGAIADYYRRRYRNREETREQPGGAQALEEGAPSVNLVAYEGGHSVHEEVLSWLRPMMDALPEKYREALYMVEVEGLSQREVAARLGLSHSGAKSRVQRARAKLGEMLKACCEVEFGTEGRVVEYRKR